MPVDAFPLAFDQLRDEVGASAPEVVTRHLQVAVVTRGELGGDLGRQEASRARNLVEERVRRAHVEDDGLGERDGAASQGDPQDLRAIAKRVVMCDERSDAGARLVEDAGHGRHTERGGDRCDRVNERAGDVEAVELQLQHFDGRLDVQPSFGVGLERSLCVAAAAARAAVRSRRAQIAISSVARGDGVHALGCGGAAEVEALRGEVPVELVEGRQRGSRHLRKLSVEHNASRVELGCLGLARKELTEGGERELSAQGKRPMRALGRLGASLHARRAPRSRNMAGNSITQAQSSIGRACSLSAADTSSGSCWCAAEKPESEPEVAQTASVVATSIGRPPGSVRTSSRSIGPRRRAMSAYGSSMRPCVSDETFMRDCHEPDQSGPPAESPWPSNGTNESAGTLSAAGNAPAATSSAANESTRCKNAVSLVGVQSSRPSVTAQSSKEASVAADRPGARSIWRRLSSTQPSRPSKHTMMLSGICCCPLIMTYCTSGRAVESLEEWTFTRTSSPQAA